MSGEQLLIPVIAAIVVAIYVTSRRRPWIMRKILRRLKLSSETEQRNPNELKQLATESELQLLTAEERSAAELEKIQALIEGRKQIAREADLAHHLWSLYESLFRDNTSLLSDRHVQNGKWYDVRILKSSTRNGLNQLEFELKGSRYRFVDDEERQSWHDHIKLFSLFLYDDSDRCLVQVPMKIRVDSLGRSYSTLSHGPEAFLPGDWISDFVNVSLKHQSMRNQDIRAQRLQERLREIEELKDKFGIPD